MRYGSVASAVILLGIVAFLSHDTSRAGDASSSGAEVKSIDLSNESRGDWQPHLNFLVRNGVAPSFHSRRALTWSSRTVLAQACSHQGVLCDPKYANNCCDGLMCRPNGGCTWCQKKKQCGPVAPTRVSAGEWYVIRHTQIIAARA